MPRGPRLDYPGSLHHVMARGIEKGLIMHDDIDRKDFLRRLGAVAEDTSTVVYAYAIMPNHFHLLVKSGQNGLPTFMRRLLTGHAQYFNKRHKRVGHLFQNRYRSEVCEEESYFSTLIAYIHLNPVKAGIVKSVNDLLTYPWTSHPVILGKTMQPWVDVEYVLHYFSRYHDNPYQGYLDFLSAEVKHDREAELSGSEKRHVQDSAQEVENERKQNIKPKQGIGILGDQEFIDEVLAERDIGAASKADKVSMIAKAYGDLAETCRSNGVSEHELQSGGRTRPLPEIRRILACRFVKEYGLSKADVGRILGVTLNAVIYMVRKGSGR